jgi:tyrosyl-tRNA synthetase
MSIPDDTMWEYFRLLTDITTDKVKNLHPKEAKLLLAQTIVGFYHSSEIAIQERKEFERVFSQKQLPQEITVYNTGKQQVDLIEVLYKAKLVISKNEARRLLSQGGISAINEQDPNEVTTLKEAVLSIPPQGIIIKVGKRKFLKLIV